MKVRSGYVNFLQTQTPQIKLEEKQEGNVAAHSGLVSSKLLPMGKNRTRQRLNKSFTEEETQRANKHGKMLSP